MSNDRLKALQGELKGILDERIAELRRAVQDTEEVTRRIVAAEMEIARYRQIREALDEEAARIEGELKLAKSGAGTAEGHLDGLAAERDRLRAQLGGLNNDSLADEVDKLRRSVSEAAREREALEGKKRELEDTLKKMKELRKQLANSINSNMKELAEGE